MESFYLTFVIFHVWKMRLVKQCLVSRAAQQKLLSQVLYFACFFSSIPRGLMARIPGFHPGGPGSIPGVGVQSFFSSCLLTKQHASSSILFLYYNFNWPTDIELFIYRVTDTDTYATKFLILCHNQPCLINTIII